MEIEIAQATKEQLVFELNNVDVSFANALRRIMLAEVPTMAIEYVNIEINDSPMHDDVLAHRLGLIPILADANNFQPCFGREDLAPGTNCIELTLDVIARNKDMKADGSVDITTKHFFVNDPLRKSEQQQRKKKGGAKADKKSSKTPVSSSSSDEDDDGDDNNFMIHQDIVITKLKAGQRIKLRCFAIRGTGADHIKYSPVSTAAYRATPSVTIIQPIRGQQAETLKTICPKNVFDIEDGELVVANMRACSVCRECVRVPEGGNGRINLGRIKDSFCFSVETVGAIAPHEIVQRSIKVLKDKCVNVRDNLE